MSHSLQHNGLQTGNKIFR